MNGGEQQYGPEEGHRGLALLHYLVHDVHPDQAGHQLQGDGGDEEHESGDDRRAVRAQVGEQAKKSGQAERGLKGMSKSTPE